jgi:putative hemolysin
MSDRVIATFPSTREAIPTHTVTAGRYAVRFARTPEELDRILRLRYEVFNVELDEGLDGSAATGRDEDDFDRTFHHLLIEERGSGEVVGTYRMQTPEMAAVGGYYSAGLFEVESLPEPVRRSAVEIGRACVARPHRNGRVLHLLWRGLAAYLAWNRRTGLFGCCSLTSQDEAEGTSVHSYLERTGAVHPAVRVLPRPECACRPTQRFPAVAPHVPALFRAYLKVGARVLGPPAIDREFKTIDWLVLLDVSELPAITFRSLFR